MTIIMNITKRLIYIFTILLLAACSDDEKYTVEPMGDDDTITFSISIPEPEKVVSRSEKPDEDDERKINDLSVLIYNADGSLLQSVLNVTDFTNNDTNKDSFTKITVKLNDDAKAHRDNVTVYIIANAGALLDDTNTTTVTALRGVTTKAPLPATDGFIMSGIVTGKLTSASLLTNKVTLYRTAAKFTIKLDDVGASGSSPATGASSFTLKSTALYNGATAGYVIAGAEKDLYAEPTTGSKKFPDDFLLYTYPCKSSESGNNTCLVVGGKYKGIDAYYRIDLKDRDTGNRLDINPNHWYEVEIKSVNSQGYPTADEAARHPSDIEVEIKDHTPTVLDMAFDGIRELGVTDSITKGESNTATLTVKYYSDIAEEMNTVPTIKSDVNWITISATGTPQPDDNGGKVVNYDVEFTTNDKDLGLGTLEGAITVTWQGLERKTAVEWVRPFNGKEICSTTTLTITPTDGTGNKVITDYWTFLSGTGTETTAAGVSPKLFGAQPDDMGGKVRNAGFHFPVMYGKKDVTTTQARWSYTYYVVTQLETSKYTITPSLSDNYNGYIKFNREADKDGCYAFTLTRDGNAVGNDGSDGSKENDYNYYIGSLILSIEPISQREAPKIAPKYVFDLYHTGFFHYDTGNHRKDSHETGYYYYEVLPVDGATGTRTRYILDRNLGAKAAGMYIQTADGSNHISSSEWPFGPGEKSAGGYYEVAYQGDNFTGPQMYDDVCPPGYRVPQQRMWDAIRNSNKFTTAQAQASASYFRAEYKTTLDVERNGVTEKETIYFPKSRYMENGSMTGDANAGYYWSQTEAAGTEKDEIGRWLKSLQITGEVTSYINGNVQTFGMSVRPINDVTDNANYNVISFNVKGATHVFLYTGDTKDKNYTTSWPGHAIGNSDTADQQFFNFVYESTVYSAANLKVIFNYVDASGKITTISKNGIDGLHDGDTWAQGWDVSDLDKYIKCDKDKSTSHIWVGNDNNENNMRQL